MSMFRLAQKLILLASLSGAMACNSNLSVSSQVVGSKLIATEEKKSVLSPDSIQITRISLASNEGYYRQDQNIDIALQFSKAVNLVETQIDPVTVSFVSNGFVAALLGPSTAKFTYLSGSGTDKLIYRYKVQAGDRASGLDIPASKKLTFNLAMPKVEGTLNATGEAFKIEISTPAADSSTKIIKTQKVIIDTAPPASISNVSFSVTNLISSPVKISWTNGDDENFSHFETKVCAKGSCDTGCGDAIRSTIRSADVPVTSDGEYTACVRALDLAGHVTSWQQSSAAMRFDTTAPTTPSGVTIVEMSGDVQPNASTLIRDSQNIAVSFSPSQDVTQITYTVQACTSQTCDAGCTATATSSSSPVSLTGFAEGSYYICVMAKDVAGNKSKWAPSTKKIILDTSAPANPGMTITGVAGAGLPGYSAGANVNLNQTATDLTAVEMYITATSGCGSGGLGANAGWEPFAAVRTYTIVANNATSTMYAKYRDQLGHLTACVSASVTHDNISPTGESIAINGGATFSASLNLTINGTATDANLAQIAITDGPGCTSSTWQTYAAAVPFTTAQANTTATISAKFRDGAGNESGCATSTILTDNLPPSGASILIDADNAYTTLGTVTLSLAATDPSAPLQMYITNTPGCSSGGVWEAFASSKAWNLASTNSTATVYVKFRDGTLNETACLNDSIIQDNLAPSPGSPALTINGDGEPGYTTLSVVSLALAATDANPIEMYVTNTAGCAAGGTWQAYAATLAGWTIAQTNGTATVYVKFRDAATNQSACLSGTVIHDNISPVANSLIINANASYTNSAALSLALSATDTNIFQMAITDGPACSSNAWLAYSTSNTLTTTQVNTTATISIKFRDYAHKESACISSSIIHDNILPTQPTSIAFLKALTNSPFPMSWSTSSDVNFDTHEVRLCPTNDCSSSFCTTFNTETGTSSRLTGVNGATYYGCTRGRDLAGNYSSWAVSPGGVTIDTSISPVLFPGVILWTAADAISASDGVNIGTWSDTSGFAYDLTQATVANQPNLFKNVLNFKPVVRFNGTTDSLSTAAMAVGESWFMVAKVTASTGNDEISGYGASRVVGRLSDQNNLAAGAANDLVGPSQNGHVYVNGTEASSLPSGFNVIGLVRDTTFGSPTSSFQVGTSGTTRFNGDIAEIIVFDHKLSDNERQFVESYLARKYALTSLLPSGHTYKSVTSLAVITNEATAKTLGPAFLVDDVDAGSASITTTLSVDFGTLSYTTTAGVTDSGNGTSSLSLTGNITNTNTLLSSLVFIPPATFTGTATISLTANDLGNTGSGGPGITTKKLAVTVIGGNTAPTARSVLARSETYLAADDMTTVGTDWSALHATVSSNGQILTIANGAGQQFNTATKSFSVDLDATPLMMVKVDSIASSWSLKVKDVATSRVYTFETDDQTAAPAVHTYDLKSKIGQTGVRNLQISVTMTGPSASGSLDWIRFVPEASTLVALLGYPVSASLVAWDPDNSKAEYDRADAGNMVSYTITQGPAHGTISGFNSGTGEFTYTSSTTYIGSDTFTYIVNDGVADSAPATVTISVIDAPRLAATGALSPANAATGVDPLQNLVLTFDHGPILASSGIITIRKQDGTLWEKIAANDTTRVSINGASVTIDPRYYFTAAATFYVEVAGDALTNGSGTFYPGFTGSATWSFTAAASVKVVAVAGGLSHSLELFSDGSVQAFGDNTFGQLGDNTTVSKTYPISVPALAAGSGVVMIDAAGSHSLALKYDGTVLAWGKNADGQLGVGNTTNQLVPTQVTSLGSGSNVNMVIAGSRFSVVVKYDGSALAWGFNGEGAVGDGTLTNRLTAVSVVTGGNLLAAADASDHVLAITRSGGVITWGKNNFGQLGNGNTTNISTPAALGSPLSSGVIRVSANSHSLALKQDGSVYAWGDNSGNQVGAGGATVLTPQLVATLSAGSGAIDIGAGSGFSVVLMSGGTILAWGTSAALGLSGVTTPTAISGLTGIAFIAVGEGHLLAVTSSGTVWGVGADGSGQLGDSSTSNRSTPVRPGPVYLLSLSPANGATSVDSLSTLTITVDKTLTAGSGLIKIYNSDTTLYESIKATDKTRVRLAAGVITITPRKYFFAGQSYYVTVDNNAFTASAGVSFAGISGTSNWALTAASTVRTIKIAAMQGAGTQVIALKNNGQVYAWGQGSLATPAQVAGLTNIVDIAAGGSHLLALDKGGALYAWGANTYGQLGDATLVDKVSPQLVPTLTTGVVAIAAGVNHSVAIKSDGTVRAFGRNASGQLGDGSSTDRTSPTAVTGLTAIAGVAAGLGDSLAVTESGALYSWGDNQFGQLGLGNTTNHLTAVAVSMPGGAVVVNIASGSNHNLAILDSGSAWAFGDNQYGQLGLGAAPTSYSTPTQITGLATISSAAAGVAHTLLLQNNGAVVAFGRNIAGELGDNSMTGQPTAVNPVGFATAGQAFGVAAGLEISFILTTGNLQMGIGRNADGQLATGTAIDQATPIQSLSY